MLRKNNENSDHPETNNSARSTQGWWGFAVQLTVPQTKVELSHLAVVPKQKHLVQPFGFLGSRLKLPGSHTSQSGAATFSYKQVKTTSDQLDNGDLNIFPLFKWHFPSFTHTHFLWTWLSLHTDILYMTYFTQTGSAACVTDLFLCTLAVTVTARRTVREGVEAGQTVVTLTAPNIVLTPTTQQVSNSYLALSVIPTEVTLSCL